MVEIEDGEIAKTIETLEAVKSGEDLVMAGCKGWESGIIIG